HLAFRLDHSAAPALLAGVRNHAPLAPAGVAGLLQAEEAMSLHQHPVPAAPPARRPLAARFGARTITFTARFVPRDVDRPLRPAVSLQQVDLELDLQVAATSGPTPAAASPGSPEHISKEVAEQVHDRFGVVEVVRGNAIQPGMAEPVVACPLVGIAEYLEGLG